MESWREKVGGGTQLEFIMAAVLCTKFALLGVENHGRRSCSEK